MNRSIKQIEHLLDITDLVPIALSFSYMLQLSLQLELVRLDGTRVRLTLVVYNLNIPSGRLRNASFASSFNNPKGAVSVCGSLANIVISGPLGRMHKVLRNPGSIAGYK
jgi:hypothetical protein